MEFTKEEIRIMRGFRQHGIDRTEDLIKNHKGFTEEERNKILKIRKNLLIKLIWRSDNETI